MWLETCGSDGADQLNGVTVDSTGGVWAVGSHENTMGCDDTTALFSGGAGTPDLFVLRRKNDATYSTVGFGAGGAQYARAVVADEAGGVWMAGDFDGTLTFNPNNSAVNFSSVAHDLFWVHLDANGFPLRGKAISGTDASARLGLAAVPGGGFVLGGRFNGTPNFGDGTPLPSSATDAFVVRYDELDNYVWHRTFGGGGLQWINDVAVDSTQAVIVTGAFNSLTDFGSGNVSPAGPSDVFLAKLHP